ncbi:MAG: hypothetical protein AAGM67_19285, partial [Bacteroidota bacterium]
MPADTCQFFLSLPPEAISNRPSFLRFLLKFAPPFCVRLLLTIPADEIEDRPGMLKDRILNTLLHRTEEEKELKRSLLCLPKEEIKDFTCTLTKYLQSLCSLREVRVNGYEPLSYEQLELFLKLPMQEEQCRREALLTLFEEAVTIEAPKLIAVLFEEVQLTVEEYIHWV